MREISVKKRCRYKKKNSNQKGASLAQFLATVLGYR